MVAAAATAATANFPASVRCFEPVPDALALHRVLFGHRGGDREAGLRDGVLELAGPRPGDILHAHGLGRLVGRYRQHAGQRCQDVLEPRRPGRVVEPLDLEVDATRPQSYPTSRTAATSADTGGAPSSSVTVARAVA